MGAGRVVRGFAWVVGGFLLVGAIGSMFTDPSKPTSRTDDAESLRSARQETQRLKDQMEADKAQSEHRFAVTLELAKAVRSSVRDPDSFTWESISANDTASVACFRYRAKNGFGGMNREFAVFSKGKLSQSADVWNRNCVGKSLYDLMSVRWAM